MSHVVIAGADGEKSHSLEAEVVTIGRGLECDIRLRDLRASRRHCQLVKVPNGVKIVDLESGNGTFVNGNRVEKEQALADGDEIQVGESHLKFHAEEPHVQADADSTRKAVPRSRPRPAPVPPPPKEEEVEEEQPLLTEDEPPPPVEEEEPAAPPKTGTAPIPRSPGLRKPMRTTAASRLPTRNLRPPPRRGQLPQKPEGKGKIKPIQIVLALVGLAVLGVLLMLAFKKK